MTDTISKKELIEKLIQICDMGWMPSARQGNDGGVGNTLEDLLGIQENNLPIPNAAEWELKCQRLNTSSLTTLFHLEPSPQALRFVPTVLLPKYGWKHDKAGVKYPATERSFRQTINGLSRTDRGFGVIVNRKDRKIEISFDAKAVDVSKHSAWIKDVEARAGLGELNPQPYWGFDDLFHKAGTKLHNCFYVQAECERRQHIEHFCYRKIMILQKFSLDNLISGIEKGYVLIDFDARTGHNHGTKFRLRQKMLPELYGEVKILK